MALIDKDQIRAEIERRMETYNRSIDEYFGKKKSVQAERDSWKWAECKSILSFLDTLPEQPVEGLEEELEKMWLEWCEDIDYLTYASIARHFAEWGAKHMKKVE